MPQSDGEIRNPSFVPGHVEASLPDHCCDDSVSKCLIAYRQYGEKQKGVFIASSLPPSLTKHFLYFMDRCTGRSSDLPATTVATVLHLMSVGFHTVHRRRQVALFPSLGQRRSSSFVQNNPSGRRMPQGEAAFLKNTKKMSRLLFTISFCYTVFPTLGLCGIRTTCIIHDAKCTK